jgi:hypothetical protein
MVSRSRAWSCAAGLIVTNFHSTINWRKKNVQLNTDSAALRPDLCLSEYICGKIIVPFSHGFDKETEADRTMMDWLMDPRVWIGLLTLTALEIVLGIDNIVFLSILVGKLRLSQ